MLILTNVLDFEFVLGMGIFFGTLLAGLMVLFQEYCLPYGF
jgi:hypothetical protein